MHRARGQDIPVSNARARSPVLPEGERRPDSVLSCPTAVSFPCNLSAVSDAPEGKCAGEPGRSGGARPIQRFEGSRPWGGDYAYSIVLGLGERLGEQLLEPARARRGLVG